MDKGHWPYRYTRLIAWFSWLVVGAPAIWGYLMNPLWPLSARGWLWLLGFCAFGPTIYVPPRGYRHVGITLTRLTAATVSPMVMIYADPHSFACTLLVIVAWELALILPMQVVLPWIVLQSVAMTALLSRVLPLKYALPEEAIYLGFQGYAVITAYVARSEAASRRDLASAYTELRSAQSLLAHSARAGERLRISRELHDLVGHHLSALVLNLEVARHTKDEWQTHVFKAQDLARQLLADVRNVVRILRNEDPAELRFMLEQVISSVPQINIDIKLAEDLHVTDAALTHVLIRVVQEAVTNAIKHSSCNNLWITVAQRDDTVEVTARDDGRGANDLHLGAGLAGMRERLEEVGGRLLIRPQAEPGFSLTAQLPMKREAA